MDSRTDGGWGREAAWVIGRALLYAGAIALLVIFAPGEGHVFVYQAF